MSPFSHWKVRTLASWPFSPFLSLSLQICSLHNWTLILPELKTWIFYSVQPQFSLPCLVDRLILKAERPTNRITLLWLHKYSLFVSLNMKGLHFLFYISMPSSQDTRKTKLLGPTSDELFFCSPPSVTYYYDTI